MKEPEKRKEKEMEDMLHRFALKGPGPELRARAIGAAAKALRESPERGHVVRWFMQDPLVRAAAALAVACLCAWIGTRLDSNLTAKALAGFGAPARTPERAESLCLSDICAELNLDPGMCLRLERYARVEQTSDGSLMEQSRMMMEELVGEPHQGGRGAGSRPIQDGQSSNRQIQAGLAS